MYSYQDTLGNKYAACIYGKEDCFVCVRITENPFSVTPIGPVRETMDVAHTDMDWYALFHGLEQVHSSISFPEKDSEPETCPLCSHYPLLFYDGKFEGDYYVTPWNCQNCSSFGRQMEKVQFDGHVMNVTDIAVPSKMIPTVQKNT